MDQRSDRGQVNERPDTFDDAVSTKMARIWAEMWLEIVRSGVPKKVATKMMLTYLQATLAMLRS
jgi:hypothetical protein